MQLSLFFLLLGISVQIALGLEERVNSPCSLAEAGNCGVYQIGQGCVECVSNNFQLSFDYPRVDCQEYFGEECLHCSDFNGCQECINIGNKYYRSEITDDESGLTYYCCKESACSRNNQGSTHCLNCNNGICSQCMNGYWNV